MKVVIYQTSDLHGYVYPTNYVTDQKLGMLKIGSFIREDEKNYDASLKIDCGDLVQGSAMTNYLAKQSFECNPIIEGMEAIGFDAYVLGNHEFNYGMDYLTRSYGAIADKMINANIEGLPLETKPYKIFDFNGFKIGCIGFTTSYIPNWEQPHHIKGLSFLDPVAEYAKYEEELKAQSDMIVVCYHGGFEKSLDEEMVPTEALTKENQGSELLEHFDSIDMILSGHQHRSFITKIGKVICSQPINNGQNFTKIVLDTETKEASYELVDVSELDGEIDSNIESIFTKLQADLEVYLDQKVGFFNKDCLLHDLFEARLKGHPFINFLHDVQLDISEADISVVSIFDCAIGFKKEVSIRDVLINYPYANVLRVIKITGEKLKQAMEKSASYFVLENGEVAINETFLVPKVQNYNYDTYGGLTYEVDLTKPFGERVVVMQKDGKAIEMDQEYTVVLSNYRATNTAIYPAYKDAEVVKEISLDISEIIINYIESRPEVVVAEKSNYRFNY